MPARFTVAAIGLLFLLPREGLAGTVLQGEQAIRVRSSQSFIASTVGRVTEGTPLLFVMRPTQQRLLPF
jgi:hypothetical protein